MPVGALAIDGDAGLYGIDAEGMPARAFVMNGATLTTVAALAAAALVLAAARRRRRRAR